MDDPTTWPEAVYGPMGAVSLRESVRELWAYREVAWSFGMRRIRTRYKQAAFGFAWAIVQPLAFLALFVGFLGRGQDAKYAAGTFGALVAWQFVNSAVSGAGSSLIGEAGLLRKVYFPRECVVLGGVGSFLPDLILNLICLVAIGPFVGVTYGWHWLLVPLLAIDIVITATAVCIPLAALAVYYRDVLYALPFLVQIWLFGSPIAYAVDRVNESWRWLYAVLNPMVGPLVGFRNIVAADRAPDWKLLAYSGAATIVLLLGGYRWFKSLEREFAEVI